MPPKSKKNNTSSAKKPSGKKSRKDDDDDALLDAAMEAALMPQHVEGKAQKTNTQQKQKQKKSEEENVDPSMFCCADESARDEHLCSLCLEVYFVDPKQVLPCGHCFCGGCFQGLTSRKDLAKSCPNCRGGIVDSRAADVKIRDELNALKGSCEACAGSWKGTWLEYASTHSKQDCAAAATSDSDATARTQQKLKNETKSLLRAILRDIKRMRKNGTSPKEIWRFIEANAGVREEDTLQYAEYLEMKEMAFHDAKDAASKQSLAWLEQAFKIRLAHGLASSPRTIKVMMRMQGVRLQRGSSREVIESFESNMKLIRSMSCDGSLEAECLRLLSKAHHGLGNYEESLECGEKALKLVETKLGKNHAGAYGILDILATTYRDTGDFQKSLKASERQLCIAEAEFGVDENETADALSNVATAHYKLGNDEKDMELSLRALAIKEKLFGREHIMAAAVLDNLSTAYVRKFNFKKGVEFAQRSLDIREAHFGKDHVETSTSLGNLANAYVGLRDFTKAIALQEKVLEIMEKHYGASHPALAGPVGNLGTAYVSDNQTEKAIRCFLQQLKMREQLLPPGHPDFQQTHMALAMCYKQKGDVKNAAKYMEKMGGGGMDGMLGHLKEMLGPQ